MARFARRFIGALALDVATYEEIEADRSCAWQAMLTIALTCVAGGVALRSWSALGLPAILVGTAVMFGAWMIWLVMVMTLGTRLAPEPRTQSSQGELFRTLGFPSAPGVVVALAALKPAAPFVLVLASVWMIAAAMIAARQALDYRSTWRAAMVCTSAFLLSFGLVAAVALAFARTVQ